MLQGNVGRICFYRLLEDEDLAEAIKIRTVESGIKAGVLFLIGTLKKAVLGYYEKGEYKTIEFNEPLEIVSCMGNVAVAENGEPIIHAHIVVSDANGKAFGGHLLRGSIVGVTAELAVIEAVGVHLKRAFDKRTKLKLLKLS